MLLRGEGPSLGCARGTVRCPFIPASSGETDAPDVEREGSRLSRCDHQSDLADACGVERRGARHVASAEAGTECPERHSDRLPVVTFWREAGLVVQTVEAVVGEEAELELLVVAAHFDHAGCGVWLASCARAGSHGGEATVALQRDCAFEDGMARRVVSHLAARDAAHHAIVDGGPVVYGGRVTEIEEQQGVVGLDHRVIVRLRVPAALDGAGKMGGHQE